MGAWFSKAFLKLWGWKILGHHPHEVDKAICAVVPHTAWQDFPLGLLVRSAMKANIRFLGKKSLFKFPFGRLMRSLGGYPVDRSKSTNFVDAVAQIFNEHEQFYVSIAPEGTRKKVEKLKTGYYWIAKQAKAAIIMVSFDYGKKEVVFHKPFFPTDNAEEDMAYLETLVSGIEGKVPENSYGIKKAIGN